MFTAAGAAAAFAASAGPAVPAAAPAHCAHNGVRGTVTGRPAASSCAGLSEGVPPSSGVATGGAVSRAVPEPAAGHVTPAGRACWAVSSRTCTRCTPRCPRSLAACVCGARGLGPAAAAAAADVPKASTREAIRPPAPAAATILCAAPRVLRPPGVPAQPLIAHLAPSPAPAHTKGRNLDKACGEPPRESMKSDRQSHRNSRAVPAPYRRATGARPPCLAGPFCGSPRRSPQR
jgi:hypothetical protein